MKSSQKTGGFELKTIRRASPGSKLYEVDLSGKKTTQVVG